MKKFTLFCLMGAAAAMPAFAEVPASASTVLYDQSPWDNEQVLKLFSTAYDAGCNYPTKAELQSIGMNIDLEFARSHTRQRALYVDATKDIVSDINHSRKLWCNLPGGYGKNTGGYPSAEFDQDVFSMWNYTSIFGSWNYGFLMAPGCWIDAAHKNGTRIYGGIKFFESWNNDGSEDAFHNFVSTKNPDGTYKYARAFVNAACFFGSDGYNYNQEGTTYRTDDWSNFHAEVSQTARELGIENFGIGQYTQNATLTTAYGAYMYGTQEKGKIFDCMLNYSGNLLAYRGVASSLTAANSLGLGSDDLYQGQLLVNLSTDYWTQMNTAATKPMNICIWGEHDQSRFFQFRVGDDPISVQANYQGLLEKAFSGANRNPLNRPAINNAWGSFQVAGPDVVDTQLNNSPGFASMFPERTAIGPSLPFETYFNLGNGESYFYKGKVTHGSWYNMSQQDIVPTYRWLVTKQGDMTTAASDVKVGFSHEDAYIGGSSLRLTGVNAATNDIVLYRTNLKATAGNVKVNVALKSGVAGANDSGLSVILRKQGSTDWIVVPCGQLADKTWEEKTFTVSGLAQNDVIEYIGLRVNSKADYNMFVGKLKVSDDRDVNPASIREGSVEVEIKEETKSSLSVKLAWEPNYDGYSTSVDAYGMVYNDEINVDHFEILYKDSENGRVQEMARTAQWAAYVGNIPMDQNASAWIGVRAVSVDLEHISPIQWVEIPRSTSSELPEVAEEDPYGKSWMSSNGNGTLENCVNNIYVEKVSTTGAETDLNYTATSNPLAGNSTEQYYFAENHKLVVRQGSTVSLTYKGFNSGTGESLKYDFVNAYMDYDGNYSFLDADETLGKFGSMNAGTEAIVTPGLTINFTVPADAHLGESRLRIVGSDAWTPHPGPTGGTVKGYSIDFPVEIVGDNTNDRKPAATYKDRRDQGDAEEPEYIEGNSSSIKNIAGDASAASVNVEGKTMYFNNTQAAWIYNITGRLVKYVADATTSVSVADLAAGVYVVKMKNGPIIRSAKVVVK